MEVVKFSLDSHYLHLISWLEQRGSYLPSKAEMPQNGCVIVADTGLVAMGFIRLVEGGYGQIDSYVSNPTQPGVIRDEAIDLLTKSLISKAKDLGIKSLLATTKDKNTLVRALEHGFKEVPVTVISLSLLTSGQGV